MEDRQGNKTKDITVERMDYLFKNTLGNQMKVIQESERFLDIIPEGFSEIHS